MKITHLFYLLYDKFKLNDSNPTVTVFLLTSGFVLFPGCFFLLTENFWLFQIIVSVPRESSCFENSASF